jgi:hypothetical protein
MINVFINGVNCPIVNDDSILITKKIVDIENPEQKQIDNSKGFLIQNTPAVATLFGMIFEVNKEIQNTSLTNFNADFNPNLKAKCVVMNDNAVVMSGYCQMLNIVTLDGNKIAYNINAYANIGNFFNDIKNLTLNALDFSDLNHAWTYDNVTDNWNPTLGEGYVYPMIDYGLTTNYNVWSITSFRPAIFVKDIIDRLFAAAGWSYSSSFFNSTRFKSLIVPFSAENLFIDNDEIYDRSFLVGRNTTVLTQTLKTYYDVLGADPIVFNDDSGLLGAYTLHNTVGNDFDITTGIWTCASAGNYQFGISASLTQTNNTGISGVYGSAQLKLFKKVGSVVDIVDGKFVNFYYTAPGTSGSTSASTSIEYTSLVVNCDAGDKLYWGIVYGNIFAGTSIRKILSNGSNINVTIAINSAFSLIPQSNIIYGDTVDMNALLPNDILQKDFILGLSKMFNLYFEQTNDNTLLIEPRDDYFTSDTVDWTNKIDIGQDVKLTPMGMNQQKRYRLTYSEDKDYQNEKYLKDYKEVYGTALIDITNDFLTETKEIKPIFAATPLSNTLGGTNNRIISDIRFADADGSNVKQGQSKLRILYWGGLISCSQYTIKNTPTGADVGYWTSYPYAGHLDNPYRPTFDLSFGQPEAVYYDFNIGASGNVTYTDSNLYSQYWYKTLQELTNKNSKVLEAFFYLSVYDFITLNFRKQYFIKEAYYRLIDVSDYNIEGTQLVKCRLLKVDREASYTTSSKSLRGGNGIFDAGGKIPTKGVPLGKDGNIIRVDNVYKGAGGYNAGADTVNNGTGNVITNVGDKVYIYGSDNVKVSAPNVFVHNSDNANIIRDGAMINGVDLERKFELEFDETFVQEIDGSTITALLPILDSNEHYEITKLYLSITGGTTNYSFTGTGDIKLKTLSGTTVGTVLGTEWLGEGSGVIAVGSTNVNTDFADNITIEADGTYSAGNRDLKLVVFYKIVIV